MNSTISTPPTPSEPLISQINRVERNAQALIRYYATLSTLNGQPVPSTLMHRLLLIETSARSIRSSLSGVNQTQNSETLSQSSSRSESRQSLGSDGGQ